MHQSDLSKPPFNAKTDRFKHYRAQVTRDISQPGPGQYDAPARQGDIQMYATQHSNSVFKDTNIRMDDPRGYRGEIRHKNLTGPGEYDHDQHFVQKTFNKTLPSAGFI